MTLGAPLGLLALLAVPAVVFLHLFRRQLRERPVAGLFLFAPEAMVASAGRQRTRLLRTASLWLECLAAAALALWLAAPSFGGGGGVHLVAVLDDSASMAAVVDGQAARDRAAAALRAAVDALPGGSRLSLLRSGPRPALLLGPRAHPAELEPALQQWQPTAPHHDLLPALDLGRELAGADGRVLLLTDAELRASGAEDVDVRRCGRAAANAAILLAVREPAAAGGERLRCEVQQFGVAAAPQALRIAAGGTVLAEPTFELAPGSARAIELPLPPGLGEVTLQLQGDALALDDAVTLLPEPLREVPVAVLLPATLRQALQLDRALAAQVGFCEASGPATAQLLVSGAPGRMRRGRTEVVVAVPGTDRDAWLPPFAIDRSHPWLSGLSLAGVVWTAGRGALPGRPLVVAGQSTLLSEELLAGGRRLWLSIDPQASNLARAPDWPILWANVLAGCRRELPGLLAVNCRVGDEIEWRRPVADGELPQELLLQRPDGSRSAGRGLGIVSWRAEQPGVHRVVDAAGAELGRVAVRFQDAVESDLSDCSSGFDAASVGPGPDAAAGTNAGLERRLLALLAIVCLLLDCLVLGRRGG